MTASSPSVEAVVIGAGPAGLATSWHLTRARVPHLVLERGRIGERWRSERWDSLTLLTPNRHVGLPGWHPPKGDPDDFVPAAAVGDWLELYARSFRPPVVTGAGVSDVRACDEGFLVETAAATHHARAVVVATGVDPWMPDWRRLLHDDLDQIHTSGYRRPTALKDGGVLVVGASASGIQIADELARSGRDVVLSVGSHIRLPRMYRGRDIYWWLDLSGKLDISFEAVADLEAARRSPSLQLVGSTDGRTVDLNHLRERGVTLAGRAVRGRGHTVDLAPDLAVNCARADARQVRLLDEFDSIATAAGYDGDLAAPYRPGPTDVPWAPTSLDLAARGITTLVWATGFRPVHPWLSVPVFDDRGRVRHQGGVADWPGLYLMGLPFMRRRRSTFLNGFGDDAADIVAHLSAYLSTRVTRPAPAAPPIPGPEGGAYATI